MRQSAATPARRRSPLVKVILLGDAKVGKTSLMGQYTENQFSSRYLATFGVDFRVANIDVDGRMVALQVRSRKPPGHPAQIMSGS